MEMHELCLGRVQVEADGLEPCRSPFIQLGGKGHRVAEHGSGCNDAPVVHVELEGGEGRGVSSGEEGEKGGSVDSGEERREGGALQCAVCKGEGGRGV